jgi:hypothetical protein
LLTLGNSGSGAGSVKIQAIVGDPSTPADEADLGFTVSATDVRRSDSSDFVGQALFRTSVQITDFANGSFGDEPGTVASAEISAPVDCVATPSPSVGGSCAMSTTADALAPDFAKEGKRTVISALAVGLLDRGADDAITPGSGTCPPTCGSGDERLVLTEGLFAP